MLNQPVLGAVIMQLGGSRSAVVIKIINVVVYQHGCQEASYVEGQPSIEESLRLLKSAGAPCMSILWKAMPSIIHRGCALSMPISCPVKEASGEQH